MKAVADTLEVALQASRALLQSGRRAAGGPDPLSR